MDLGTFVFSALFVADLRATSGIVTIDPRPTRDRPAIIRGHAILAEKMFVNYVSTAILSYCLRFGTKLEHNELNGY